MDSTRVYHVLLPDLDLKGVKYNIVVTFVVNLHDLKMHHCRYDYVILETSHIALEIFLTCAVKS